MINGLLTNNCQRKNKVSKGVKMAEKTFEFKVIINGERYYNEDTNYGVYTFTTDDNIPEFDVYKDPFEPTAKEVKMSVLTGRMQQLYIGSEYTVRAKLELNKKYNSWNYVPTSVTTIMPKTIESQRKFLESLATKNQVDSLLAAYPQIVEEVINGRDEIDYSKTKWIKQATWEKLKEKIINNYVISDILLLLQPLGVTFNMIKKLINNEPNPELLKKKLLENPYMLTEIPGLGFKRVDDLALKLKPELRLSHQRVYAFLNYYLHEIGDDEGHTWVKIDTLENAIRDNIYECEDLFKEVIELEKANNGLLCFEEDQVGLKYYKSVEMNIFNILQTLDTYTRCWKIDVEKSIEEAESEQGFKLTQEQKDVVKKATESNVVVISGKAGTGKSTLLRAILKVYKHYSIGCCALSAKAAQRITEATGRPAMTIHRLLGAMGLNLFTYNHQCPLPYDVVVLDESSMVNARIFYDLVSSVKEGAKIIMCGDNRQLPPIGYANVFSDLLDMKDIFNVNQLTKVMRQAEMSGILSDANKIREGISPIEQPELKIVTGELQDMYYMFRDNREALNNIAIKTYLKTIEDAEVGTDEVVIAVPRKKDCINSTQEINIQIQDALFSKDTPYIQRGSLKFRKGAKVMQVVNNYEKNVFNGDIGYIKDIWQDERTGKDYFSVSYKDEIIDYTKSELSQIELAYAMTVHKLQGSGYHTVIGIIDATHYTLLDSCMLYTLITRAKKRCLLLPEPSAFKKCIDNNKSIGRQTWLSQIQTIKT
jgi:exodeoxyribonuclease V alpha subunit